MDRTSATALIVAAGRGTRAGGPIPKQWQMLGPRPVLAHTVAAFGDMPVLVVIHPDDRARAEAALPGIPLVDGGATRAVSVRAGLAQVTTEIVLIHDGARPSVSAALIDRVLRGVVEADAAAPAIPVMDALWRGADVVEGMQDRAGLWRAQTPQGFRTDAIRAAHDAFQGEAVDDVEVARAAGLRVGIVPGDEANIKITAPEDFARVEKGLRMDAHVDVRVGNGFDVHRFGPGDHVMLCGVRIPHGRGLQGHSDADVGLHTITDALYGGLAAGDIGRHFPPSDPQWKGVDSQVFLDHAAALARTSGYRIANVDATLICEYPKVGPHAGAMCARVAGILGVEVGRVSIKATTSERLGFTGRGEGIACQATVTLVRG